MLQSPTPSPSRCSRARSPRRRGRRGHVEPVAAVPARHRVRSTLFAPGNHPRWVAKVGTAVRGQSDSGSPAGPGPCARARRSPGCSAISRSCASPTSGPGDPARHRLGHLGRPSRLLHPRRAARHRSVARAAPSGRSRHRPDHLPGAALALLAQEPRARRRHPARVGLGTRRLLARLRDRDLHRGGRRRGRQPDHPVLLRARRPHREVDAGAPQHPARHPRRRRLPAERPVHRRRAAVRHLVLRPGVLGRQAVLLGLQHAARRRHRRRRRRRLGRQCARPLRRERDAAPRPARRAGHHPLGHRRGLHARQPRARQHPAEHQERARRPARDPRADAGDARAVRARGRQGRHAQDDRRHVEGRLRAPVADPRRHVERAPLRDGPDARGGHDAPGGADAHQARRPGGVQQRRDLAAGRRRQLDLRLPARRGRRRARHRSGVGSARLCSRGGQPRRVRPRAGDAQRRALARRGVGAPEHVHHPGSRGVGDEQDAPRRPRGPAQARVHGRRTVPAARRHRAGLRRAHAARRDPGQRRAGAPGRLPRGVPVPRRHRQRRIVVDGRLLRRQRRGGRGGRHRAGALPLREPRQRRARTLARRQQPRLRLDAAQGRAGDGSHDLGGPERQPGPLARGRLPRPGRQLPAPRQRRGGQGPRGRRAARQSRGRGGAGRPAVAPAPEGPAAAARGRLRGRRVQRLRRVWRSARARAGARRARRGGRQGRPGVG